MYLFVKFGYSFLPDSNFHHFEIFFYCNFFISGDLEVLQRILKLDLSIIQSKLVEAVNFLEFRRRTIAIIDHRNI